ncbi:hypothetical protein ACFRCW_32610 [Streptomyces sp. NPDC056653]|uniref:hypothetical protein n=1 Tax=Streptomyces sp. NPDC056653 TaxID=3345894 RepID=UPI00368A599D
MAAQVCEALGLATESRTVTAGRRPVMEIEGVPHELIGWTARRGEQIDALPHRPGDRVRHRRLLQQRVDHRLSVCRCRPLACGYVRACHPGP